MSLKFTALEVGSGDAFLLEDENRKILFDSGGSKNKIVALLRKKGITKIDLAICSHNDKDHSKGFLGLLNSKIRIGEIWLPGTWASVIHSVTHLMRHSHIIGCRNGCCWYDEFLDCLSHFEINEGCYKFHHEESLAYEEYIPNNQLIEDMSFINTVLDIDCIDYCRYCKNKDHELSKFRCSKDMKFRECFRENIRKGMFHIGEHATKLMIQLDTIISITEAAYKNGVNIRWFEPTDACTKKRVDTNIIVLNGSELTKAISTRRIDSFHMLMFALTLTMENKYSLAMEYLHDEIPVVRFSADSDSTCQSEIPYRNNFIITAPHHGSDANANVYRTIKGNDIIWVRSDALYRTQGRPCLAFKSMNKKYCLACKHRKPVRREICFEYDNNTKQWLYKIGISCICKP